MDYCFTFLCSGKYTESLRKRLEENSIFNDANLVITTDEPAKFTGLGEVFKFNPEQRSVKGSGRKWFNYNLKRKAIRNAALAGFNKIFYIDSDVEVFSWDESFFIREDKGAFFRRYLKRKQHPVKYEFYDKIFRLSKWRMHRAVSEKIMYFNEDIDKIKDFTETWEYLDIISNGHITPPSEGQEIRISCKVNEIEVHTYNPDPFKKAGGNTMKDRELGGHNLRGGDKHKTHTETTQ